EGPLAIVGSALDPKAIAVAEAAAKAAGLAKELRFRAEPVARAKPRGDYGCLITNPPYGERLGDQKEVERALRSLGLLVAQLPTWSTFVLSPSKQMEHYLGRKADKKRKLYNGRIECQLTQLFGPLPPRPKSAPKP
ncbi:class I SAM-dependent RNA methyltransferase, partial [Paenibacillus larvae]